MRGVHAVCFKQARLPMLLAKETALDELTNLATRALPPFAIEANDWQRFVQDYGIEDFHYEYEAEAIIETWRYDPAVQDLGNTVYPPSLYARYRDDADERMAQAANALLEARVW